MTFNAEQIDYINRQLFTARIIFLGLTTGVVIFVAFAFVLDSINRELVPEREVEAEPLPVEEPPPESVPIVTYVATGFALVAVVLSVVVPGMIGSIRQKLVNGEEYQWPNEQFAPPPEVGEVGPLVAHALMRMIVGLAILEGAAFFNVVAYMLERQPLSLIMTGLLLLVMLLKFPTRGRLENWLRVEIRTIEELRSLRT